MRILLLLTFVFINLFAIQVRSIDNEVENGKTALITFSKQDGIKYENITFGKKKFPIVNSPVDKECCFALLPVSYYEKAESKEFYVNYLQGKEEESTLLFLDVRTGIYKHEEIHVDSSKVNPKSKQVQARISKEYNKAMQIYNTVTPKLYITKPFDMPLESKITSDFGKARVYNGSLKGYHSGTDFRAKVGTPIKASNDGKVALVAKRFYSGGTVLIDHGYGIYTCYFHMSKFDVKEGQLVQKGQVIGLSGESGRVTGPHLHFSARINGVQVDPLQMISLLNTQILKDNN
ncbi:M23 family metallopeptidase [Sulfurimonas marina]|uniref:M23 family metallopeptidase n=1 Tax=Sulfurimonas marina TaxID=2590551 RepID=A0A7M1AZC0_9BACT|nr:M23 family metallopeptidase [Sulfurimonas marina]QOP41898.1 M23 family metallopeptidase [Sulfurimonas marina]